MVDLIFFTEDDLVSKVVVGDCLARIDHHMVWCTVDAKVGPEVVKPRESGSMEPWVS